MVRELVACGLGYSLLTQKTAITASYDRHAFVTVPLADQLPALQIVVAQIASARPTRRAQHARTSAWSRSPRSHPAEQGGAGGRPGVAGESAQRGSRVDREVFASKWKP